MVRRRVGRKKEERGINGIDWVEVGGGGAGCLGECGGGEGGER